MNSLANSSGTAASPKAYIRAYTMSVGFSASPRAFLAGTDKHNDRKNDTIPNRTLSTTILEAQAENYPYGKYKREEWLRVAELPEVNK